MISIIAIGKPQLHYVIKAVEYYQKKIQKLKIPIKLYYIKENSKLKQKIEKFIAENRPFTVILDEKGTQLTSPSFSHLFQQHTEIAFIIGGPDGLPKNLSIKENLRLSLSLMTFSHELALVILLEQIFRGLSIINHIPYHR